MHLRVIAPSFKISDEDWTRTQELLKRSEISYEVRLPLFEKSESLCAASEAKRGEDLKEALLAPQNPSVVWCLRGGYGALHLLPLLQKLKTPKFSKLVIGFSDITVLHYFINQKWGWPSLHYRHLNSFVKDQSLETGLKEFHRTCKNLEQKATLTYKGLKPLNLKAQNAVKAARSIKFSVVGGNLITLQSMIGLEVPKPHSKQWLFLEEIDEPIYKIDRAWTQLVQAGWLNNIGGVLLGSFTHQHPRTQKDIGRYLRRKFEGAPFPVFGFLPCGHRQGQKPLFLNTPSMLSFTGGAAHFHNTTIALKDMSTGLAEVRSKCCTSASKLKKDAGSLKTSKSKKRGGV